MKSDQLISDISHKTVNREIYNHTNLDRISHKTFNGEILNHTNMKKKTSHKTVKKDKEDKKHKSNISLNF